MSTPFPQFPVPSAPGVPDGGFGQQAPAGVVTFGRLMQDASTVSFDALPVGEYVVQVAEATTFETSTGKPAIKVKMPVAEGPAAGKNVFNNFVLSEENPTALSIWFRQMAAFGLDAAFMTPLASLPPMQACEHVARALYGKRVRLKLKHREWQGRTMNDIEQVYPAGGPVAAAPAPAPGIPVPGAAYPGFPPQPQSAFYPGAGSAQVPGAPPPQAPPSLPPQATPPAAPPAPLPAAPVPPAPASEPPPAYLGQPVSQAPPPPTPEAPPGWALVDGRWVQTGEQPASPPIQSAPAQPAPPPLPF